MAFSCNRHNFLYLWSSLVALIWNVTLALSVSEQIHFRAETDGNVTIRCPFEKSRAHELFYFQRNDDNFVNGYYTSKPKPPSWENTAVDDNETAVHMYSLNISHNGIYKCIIKYKEQPVTTVFINLTVTANYSKPTVTTFCDDEVQSCFVTCASHGGFPKTQMMLNVPDSRKTSSQMWRLVNSSEVPCPSTLVFNSSSTTYFNCSGGELEYLSCSVGEVTSDQFSICKPRIPPNPITPVILAASFGVVVFCVMVGLLLYCQCKQRPTRIDTDADDVRQEWTIEMENRDEEETTVLS